MSCDISTARMIWNKLERNARKRILSESSHIEANDKDLNYAATLGWSRMLSWLGINNKYNIDDICRQIVKEFT